MTDIFCSLILLSGFMGIVSLAFPRFGLFFAAPTSRTRFTGVAFWSLISFAFFGLLAMVVDTEESGREPLIVFFALFSAACVFLASRCIKNRGEAPERTTSARTPSPKESYRAPAPPFKETRTAPTPPPREISVAPVPPSSGSSMAPTLPPEKSKPASLPPPKETRTAPTPPPKESSTVSAPPPREAKTSSAVVPEKNHTAPPAATAAHTGTVPSGKYSMDIGALSCTCPDWQTHRRNQPGGHPSRLCQHLAEYFTYNPGATPETLLPYLGIIHERCTANSGLPVSREGITVSYDTIEGEPCIMEAERKSFPWVTFYIGRKQYKYSDIDKRWTRGDVPVQAPALVKKAKTVKEEW